MPAGPVTTTLQTIHDAIVAGFNQAILTDGSRLTATSSLTTVNAASDATLPLLSFKSGSFTTDDWRQWETRVIWDIPAELKVRGSFGEGGTKMRQVLQDIFQLTGRIQGLPVDERDRLFPYTTEMEVAAKMQKGELRFLADRGGPILKTVKVRPESPDDPYAIADLVWRFEVITEYSPDEFTLVRTVHTGANILDATRREINTDPLEKFSLPVPAIEDTVSQTAFVEPATVLLINGVEVEPGFPPIPEGIVYLAGSDPDQNLNSLNVSPYTSTIAVAGTVQLQCIATYQSGRAVNVKNGVAWGTTNAAVAFSTNTGLVSGQGLGTCNITATFGGIVSQMTVTVA